MSMGQQANDICELAGPKYSQSTLHLDQRPCVRTRWKAEARGTEGHAEHSAGRMRSQGALRTKPGKLTGNPSCSVLWKGCQNTTSTSHLHLNTTSLSPNSFFLSLTSHVTCNPL